MTAREDRHCIHPHSARRWWRVRGRHQKLQDVGMENENELVLLLLNTCILLIFRYHKLNWGIVLLLTRSSDAKITGRVYNCIDVLAFYKFGNLGMAVVTKSACLLSHYILNLFILRSTTWTLLSKNEFSAQISILRRFFVNIMKAYSFIRVNSDTSFGAGL